MIAAAGGSATVVVEENDVAEFSLSVEPNPVAEGSSATLTLEITNGVPFAEHQTISLAARGGTATAGTDFALSARSLTLRGSSRSVTARLGGETIATLEVTIRDRAAVPLTAEFTRLPASHDGGSTFVFELRFCEQIKISYRTLRDAAFEVTGGTVTGARRLEPPSNRRWEIAVQPDSGADVVLGLPETADCAATAAICTAGGKKLSQRVTARVKGPGPEPAGFPRAPENGSPSGIWSDGDTAWAADLDDARLYAYRRSDGERQPAKDIETDRAPMGLWSDGVTLWVADWRERLYAYRLADGQRLPRRDIAATAGDTDPTGLWSGGGTLLSTSWEGREVRAYRLPVAEGSPAADGFLGRSASGGGVAVIADPALQAAIREALVYDSAVAPPEGV